MKMFNGLPRFEVRTDPLNGVMPFYVYDREKRSTVCNCTHQDTANEVARKRNDGPEPETVEQMGRRISLSPNMVSALRNIVAEADRMEAAGEGFVDVTEARAVLAELDGQ